MRALRSGFLTTGPAVEEFERALAQVMGDVHVAAVSSGTAALHAAYAAASVGGGEVVTSPLTFASTATTAIALGATVRFADIDDSTLCLDPAAAAAAVGPATRAVTAVDYAGQPADIDALMPIAHDAGALLVEDAAHAIGGTLHGRPVGALADLTTFSFHPVKTVTTGEGGAVATADAELDRVVREFRSHGMVRDRGRQQLPDEGGWHQEMQSFGLNYRLPDILAALGTSQLARLDSFVARRTELVGRYREHLAGVDGVRLLDIREGARPAWHLFVVRILGGRRREVYDALHAEGVLVQVHYLPAHLHPYYADLGYRRGTCPVAEAAYEEILSLPLYPTLRDDQQDRVIELLRKVVGER